MNPILRPLANLFLEADKVQFRIPRYQRNYKWEPKRANSLLNFIFEIADTQNFKDTNFIGFMVTEPTSLASSVSVTKHDVIDGQQRLTTFSLCWLAIHRICENEIEKKELQVEELKKQNNTNNEKYKALQDEVNFLKKYIDKLYYRFIENELVKGDYFQDKLKFVPAKRNQDKYRDILDRKPLDEEDKNIIISAYTLIRRNIRKQIISKNEISIDKLERLVAALQSIQVVQLELKETDDPQQIFETINHKGMPLSAVDLIRNHIFNNNDQGVSDRFYKTYWEPTEAKFYPGELEKSKISSEASEANMYDYVRCILMRNGQYLTKQRLFPYFKGIHTSNDKIEVFLKDFQKLANYYLVYTHPEWNISLQTNQALCLAAETLKNLDFAAPIQFLIKLHEDNIQENDILNTIKILENYFVRRSLIDLRVQNLPKVFNKICELYQTSRVEGQPIAEWLTELFKLDQKRTATERLFEYPTDDEIVQYLSIKNIYITNKNIVKYVYLELNRKKMGREFPKDEALKSQIEHIMPQSLSKEWKEHLKKTTSLNGSAPVSDELIDEIHAKKIGLIGNLTLTFVNQEMSNKLYDFKKSELKKSRFSYTNSIPDKYSNWDFDVIDQRNPEIIKLILDRFPNL